jgi:hypothetical protein
MVCFRYISVNTLHKGDDDDDYDDVDTGNCEVLNSIIDQKKCAQYLFVSAYFYAGVCA